MTDTHTPRRPLVPSPNQGSGITSRAIELRNQQAQQAGLTQKHETPEDRLRRENPLFTVPGPVGKIAEAISGIMAKAGTIKKGGYNAYHKYHYVRMEDLLETITPLMGAAGLAVIQNEIEIKNIEGNRVAVVYEFSIFHKSGEIWNERPRHTGMATSRDSKGNWDDKSISKAHTNARKYFLLGLFQIPAGDFEDLDEDANQRQEQRPVPAPKQPEAKSTSREGASGGTKEITEEAKARASEKAAEEGIPHKIVLGQGAGADQWAGAYIKAVEKANSEAEIKDWDNANDETLQAISDRYSKVYLMIETAVKKRLEELGANKDPREFGDGPTDLQERMNWIATTLQGFNVYKDAEDWWNEKVAPSESNWDTVDWEMLMAEWKRTEARLGPPPQDAA